PLRVKVCGVTTPADAEMAARLGADAVGLNFYPPSPRCVDDAAAAAVLHALPPFVEAVRVFVNQPPQRMAARPPRPGPLARPPPPRHPGDPPDPVDPPPSPLIVAPPVHSTAGLAALTSYLDRWREAGRLPAALLLDAHVPGLFGGTGRTAPWDLLVDFRPGVPVILAGGLTPDNVAEAVRRGGRPPGGGRARPRAAPPPTRPPHSP